MRDALRIEPVDQALHLRHHFGADAVAGEKQQFMGRHGKILARSLLVIPDAARSAAIRNPEVE
jgi:hypothetical protein